MRVTDNLVAKLLRLTILMAALGFSGCAVLAPEPPPEPAPTPEPVEPAPTPVEVPPPPPPAPRKAVRILPPPALPTLAIVLTSGVAAYADVARELSRQFEKHTIYNLESDARAPVSIMRSINDSDTGVVVAIGRRAAVSSVALSESPVIFSQVFNYQDLLTENSRGVAVVAPIDAQIAAWKELDPSIERVGTIVGTGHDELLIEARDAAERHGIELHAHVADSDQETVFKFKRFIRDIDGYWLFPDNRILSPRALQQIITAANEHRVPVLVPSESMLTIGASISISSVASDIAATITRIVRQIEAGALDKVPPVTPLSEIRVVTEDALKVADR